MPKGDGRGFFWHFWAVRGDTSLQSQAIPCLSSLPESCLHACVCARCRHRGPGHRLAARTPGPPGHSDRPRGARRRRERRQRRATELLVCAAAGRSVDLETVAQPPPLSHLPRLRPPLGLDPLRWRGGMAFLAACNAQTSRDPRAKLLALAASSRTAFEARQADLAPDCDFSAIGTVVLY